jgi:hypothetical protein
MFQKTNLMVVIWVDDVLTIGREAEVNKFKEHLKMKYDTKFLGDPKKYLGLQIRITPEEVELSMMDKIEELVREAKRTMWYRKTRGLPGVDWENANKEPKNCSPEQKHEFRSAVGKLLFIAGQSRPDISFAVRELATFGSSLCT